MAIDPELSREFDTGVEQDEILAGGGDYPVATVPGTTWKALVIIGVVVTIAGFVLILMAAGYLYPIPDYYPTPLGSGLFLTVPIAGILILIAGIAAAIHNRRDPPIEPIV